MNTDTLMMIYSATAFIGMFIMIIIQYMVSHNIVIDKKVKGNLLATIGITALMIVGELVISYYELYHLPFNTFYIILNIIGFSASPFVGVFVGLVFDSKKSKYSAFLLVPLFVNIICVFLSPSFGLIFQITRNTYARGPLFFIYIISYVFVIIFTVSRAISFIRRYNGSGVFSLFLIALFLVFGTSIQIINSHIHVSWLCIAIGIAIFYAYFCELHEKIDILTDVFNRRAYEYDIKAMEKYKKATIIYFDVDNFKLINDKHGHDFGDHCLKETAKAIKRVFISSGRCYRIGGDEFCVITKNTDEANIKSLLALFDYDIDNGKDKNIYLTNVSHGYSIYDRTKTSIHFAVNEADAAMYKAKNKNK